MFDTQAGSIIKFFYDTLGIQQYYDEVTSGFVRPSVYFPAIEYTPLPDTATTFRYEFSWFINIFDDSTSAAATKARIIMDAIQSNRRFIPTYTKEGVKLPKPMEIAKASSSKIDEGVMQITLDWKVHHKYEIVEVPKVSTFVLDTIKKEVSNV